MEKCVKKAVVVRACLRLRLKMRHKVRVSINLTLEAYEKAKNFGLNISKVCENALIQAIKALEEVFPEKRGEGTTGSPLVRPPGFEPGLSAREADVLTRLDYGR